MGKSGSKTSLYWSSWRKGRVPVNANASRKDLTINRDWKINGKCAYAIGHLTVRVCNLVSELSFPSRCEIVSWDKKFSFECHKRKIVNHAPYLSNTISKFTLIKQDDNQKTFAKTGPNEKPMATRLLCIMWLEAELTEEIWSSTNWDLENDGVDCWSRNDNSAKYPPLQPDAHL